MLDCWQPNPENRPSFSNLSDFFHKMLASATEKNQLFKCNSMNIAEQPLLQIRKREQGKVFGEFSSPQLKQKVSVRHGANRKEFVKNVLLSKYGLRNVKFAHDYKE